jgi:hypothetical protein
MAAPSFRAEKAFAQPGSLASPQRNLAEYSTKRIGTGTWAKAEADPRSNTIVANTPLQREIVGLLVIVVFAREVAPLAFAVKHNLSQAILLRL